MSWIEIAGAVTELLPFPFALYYAYLNKQSKFYKKTWMLAVIVVGFLASGAHVSLNYLDKQREADAERARIAQKLKNSVDKQGTLAANDVAFESPDGYRILIPAGYSYSKPSGTPFSLLALKNYDTVQTPGFSVLVSSSSLSNAEFTDKLKQSLQEQNTTTKFFDPATFKSGSTEINRLETTSVRANGPVHGFILIATDAGKNYAVIIATREDMFTGAKPEFERIASSFSVGAQEAKPVAAPPAVVAAPAPVSVPVPAPAVPAPALAPEPAPAPAPAKVAAPALHSAPTAAEASLEVRRAAMQREEEARRRLKAPPSPCVYKPVMTDEDLAKCR